MSGETEQPFLGNPFQKRLHADWRQPNDEDQQKKWMGDEGGYLLSE